MAFVLNSAPLQIRSVFQLASILRFFGFNQSQIMPTESRLHQSDLLYVRFKTEIDTNQTVQDSKKHLLKMTVAKKPDQTVRYKMAPLKNDWPKKSHPSSATYKNGAFSK